MPAKIDIILLAAGKSERMGLSNKLLLPVQGKPLLEKVLAELVKVDAGQKMVVTGHEAEKISSIIPAGIFSVVYNPDFERGMTGSIQCGINSLNTDSMGILIIPGDLPHIKATALTRLIDQFYDILAQNKKAIVAAADQGIQKNPVIFSSYYYSTILQHTSPNGCKKIIEQHSENLTLVEISDSQFFSDIDTPADYALIQP